jgi:hypothetical protein
VPGGQAKRAGGVITMLVGECHPDEPAEVEARALGAAGDLLGTEPGIDEQDCALALEGKAVAAGA